MSQYDLENGSIEFHAFFRIQISLQAYLGQNCQLYTGNSGSSGNYCPLFSTGKFPAPLHPAVFGWLSARLRSTPYSKIALWPKGNSDLLPRSGIFYRKTSRLKMVSRRRNGSSKKKRKVWKRLCGCWSSNRRMRLTKVNQWV